MGDLKSAKYMDFLDQLRGILPAKAMLTAAEDRAAYETDWRRLYHHSAVCVVLPETVEQAAGVVSLCSKTGMKIVPQGGNTGLVGGGVPGPGGNQIVVSLARMNKILALDPAGNTITVQAGVTLHAVQQAAAAAGRFFPVSIGAEGTAQTGGVISTNAGGVQVLSYGSMRAQVLGLQVVLADGRIWNGLRTLKKDNTGFDLKQFFIGAEGTLGLITAAALRLQPAVTQRATALAGAASIAAALELFQTIRANTGAALTLCEFISGPVMALAASYTSSGHAPFAAPDYLLLEISGEGGEAQLEEALAEALQNGAITDAVMAKSEGERLKLLALREAVPESEIREGGAIKHDISVPLARLPEMAARVTRLAADKYPDCRLSIFGHMGDGNLHINFRPPAGQTLASLDPRKAQITLDVENLAMALAGSFSAEHGIGLNRLASMAAHKSAVELDMMRAVKHALDPHGVFNPGKVIPGP